ncbi:tRNA pseudouridine(38-40) synthase TruA [Prochlorothrix hollandica]|uniref:tRNA pseudouridine(38-40) synthase TruA n=1 Tax=Prochlorothrix hollandica TaxID=1223 RepID=UPI00333F19E8
MAEALIQRIALVVQYLGTDFCGWQWQPRQRTVQGVMEAVIGEIVGQPVTVHAAGRTDSGVHAAAQVVHFDVASPIPAQRWMSVLNGRLPPDVVVRASVAVPPTWHARFSASWRRYRYTLYTDRCPNLFLRSSVWHYYHQTLDADVMAQALQPLLGHHHLAAFQRSGSSRPHAWVEIQEVYCCRRDTLVEIEVQASGFLYGMMRLLVGLLVQVGAGTYSPAAFTRIWVDQRRDLVKHSAPAQGLCLNSVGYPQSPFDPVLLSQSQPRFWFPPTLDGSSNPWTPPSPLP